MALKNLYWGATISETGGSYLYSKAIINIKEGYQIGSSLHQVNLGDFEVDSFENSGTQRQLLNISTTSPAKRLNNTNVLVNQSYYNNKSFLDDFVDSNFYLSNWYTDNNDWSIGNDLLSVTNPSFASFNICTAFDSLKNVRVIAKLKSSSFSTNLTRPGLFIRGYAVTPTTSSGYLLEWVNGVFQLNRKDADGSSTTLASFTQALSNNTYYWFMIVAVNSQIKAYYSSDGKSYTLIASVNDSTYRSGFVALREKGTGTFTTDYDFVDIQEIGNEYTNGDILRNTLALSGIFNVNFAKEQDGFSNYVSNIGSSWVSGSTNEVTFYPTTGTSWSTFVGNTSKFSEFVMECEVNGSSGNMAGLVIGLSNNRFFGNYYRFGGTSVVNNVIFWSGTGSTYNGRGDYVALQDNRWYKLKVVRSNFDIRWYVNDLLTNSISGISLLTVLQAVNPRLNLNGGVFGYQTGSSTVRFRNLSISSLDQLVEDVEIEPNQNLASVFSRYLPEGFVYNWKNSMEIYPLGTSRGQYNIGPSNYIVSSTEEYNNSVIDHVVIVNGLDVAVKESGDNSRYLNQADSLRVNIINDQGIQTAADARSLANAQLKDKELQFNPINIDIHPLVHLEQYDYINYVDLNLGISRQTTLRNNVKNYDSTSGDFRQTLTLG